MNKYTKKYKIDQEKRGKQNSHLNVQTSVTERASNILPVAQKKWVV